VSQKKQGNRRTNPQPDHTDEAATADDDKKDEGDEDDVVDDDDEEEEEGDDDGDKKDDEEKKPKTRKEKVKVRPLGALAPSLRASPRGGMRGRGGEGQGGLMSLLHR